MESFTDAKNFIDKMRSELSNIIERIINHPYLEALDKKQVPYQKLELFVYEQYNIIANDRKNFAIMISKASSDTSTKLFTEGFLAETRALDDLVRMAVRLGVTVEKLKAYNDNDYDDGSSISALAGCNAYTNYLTRLAVHGSDAEILAAVLIDFPVWGANCGLMSTLLRKNYGFDDQSCAFLDAFSAPLPEMFVNSSYGLIAAGLPQKRREMKQAARLILEYELLFWDTIYEHSKR